MKDNKQSYSPTIISQTDSGDRLPFAGSREMFCRCTNEIGDVLKCMVNDSINIRPDTSALECLRYLHGESARLIHPTTGKKNYGEATRVSRLDENAYSFLRLWIDDDDDDNWSDEGEPWYSRYNRSVPFYVAWVQSFKRIRLPIGKEHVLILCPHQRSSPSLCIDVIQKEGEERSTNSLMTICKIGSRVDVLPVIGGCSDFGLHMVTLLQFKEEYVEKNEPFAVPDNVSHVFVVFFSNERFNVMISPWVHRKTSHLWKSVDRLRFYNFTATFLCSQLTIQ
jgi:hypothetical protein